MKIKLIVILSFFIFSQNILAEEKLVGFSQDKGIFALGFLGGMTKSGLLNSNGNFSGYDVTNLGADLDFRLWGSGSGEFRLFLSYLTGTGQGSSSTNNNIRTEETILGVKVSVNSYLYLAAGAGPGKMILTSSNNNTEIKMTNTLTRMSMGLDFPISSSFYLGADLSYRSGPVKKSENSSLTENSFYEGSAVLLRLIWSPPAVTNTYIK